MHCLVTGATGFVGKELVSTLLQRNHYVVEAGRNGTENPLTTFVEVGNISSMTDWSNALEDCTIVFHLAARVHVMKEDAQDPLTAFQEVNLYGTINLARQAASAGVKRFVYVSSVKVNGEATYEKAFCESDAPSPQDPYAQSKWQAELALMKTGEETGMEVVIVRPPLIYGAGVKANFHSLMRVVNQRVPLPFGCVNNLRSMVYVKNLANALMLCGSHPEAAGKTYLISDGKDVSIGDLVRLLSTAMGKPAYLFPFPEHLLKKFAWLLGKSKQINRLVESLQVNSTKIRKDLGWIPPYTMQEGIDATVKKFYG